MNSTQIQCFLKAAELLNFTDAAAALHISQPAFSRNIALLENEWNIALFLRSNKQKATQLTPAGKAMYDGLQEIIQQYEELLKTAQSIHSGHAGSLNVGLISSDRIDNRMLRVLDFFHDHYPDVELALRRGSHSELVRWLYDNTVDLAFCLETEVADKPWVQSVPLYSIDSVLILSSKHSLLKKNVLTLSDFKDEVFINVSSRESAALNALLTVECQKAGFTPKVVEAENISEQTLLLESGKGVAIGSINNTACYNSNLTFVHLPELRPLPLVMAWNVNNPNPCAETFRSAYEPIE
jgi:DNA-binding transcriptional LysR family regulator